MRVKQSERLRLQLDSFFDVQDPGLWIDHDCALHLGPEFLKCFQGCKALLEAFEIQVDHNVLWIIDGLVNLITFYT